MTERQNAQRTKIFVDIYDDLRIIAVISNPAETHGPSSPTDPEADRLRAAVRELLERE